MGSAGGGATRRAWGEPTDRLEIPPDICMAVSHCVRLFGWLSVGRSGGWLVCDYSAHGVLGAFRSRLREGGNGARLAFRIGGRTSPPGGLSEIRLPSYLRGCAGSEIIQATFFCETTRVFICVQKQQADQEGNWVMVARPASHPFPPPAEGGGSWLQGPPPPPPLPPPTHPPFPHPHDSLSRPRCRDLVVPTSLGQYLP